jgi:hypothetical protein
MIDINELKNCDDLRGELRVQQNRYDRLVELLEAVVSQHGTDGLSRDDAAEIERILDGAE